MQSRRFVCRRERPWLTQSSGWWGLGVAGVTCTNHLREGRHFDFPFISCHFLSRRRRRLSHSSCIPRKKTTKQNPKVQPSSGIIVGIHHPVRPLGGEACESSVSLRCNFFFLTPHFGRSNRLSQAGCRQLELYKLSGRKA